MDVTEKKAKIRQQLLQSGNGDGLKIRAKLFFFFFLPNPFSVPHLRDKGSFAHWLSSYCYRVFKRVSAF
ncbi:hypothetical protein V6N13_071443 [Hibiscus sabdariffa]|uniref:Uncharacterized protein n=1 Tax=Hibiscus sabdariffa TaxID=183260 RepID=A0ABR2TE63_9ROSI